MSSLFTRIINNEIPCTKVYEDDKCLAFLDINPVTKWHTLLVPKQEYVRMTDTPDELVWYLFIQAKKIMQQMKQNLWVEYVELVVEWLEIAHFHIHLIPNMLGNKIVKREHTTYEEWEAEMIAKKIQW
jgi:histidine triad (HIT) family protein